MFNTYDKYKNDLTINTEIPFFCEQTFHNPNKKCRRFYEELSCGNDFGLFVCPYGFTCLKSEKEIYSSLIVEGHYNYNKVKEHLERYKQKLNDFTHYSQSQIFKIADDYESISESRDIYSHTVHDIKNANQAMLDLLEAVDSNKDIQVVLSTYVDLQSLAEGYNVIKYRLDYHDWALSGTQGIPYNNREGQINLHKIITKLNIQLKYRALKRNVTLKIEGNSFITMTQKASLFLGYFLILENAIKYSIQNSTVTIKLHDNADGSVDVKISNRCVDIDADDIPKLKNQGFRSRAAKGVAQGNGLGLTLADGIFRNAASELKINYHTNKDKETGLFEVETVIRPLVSDGITE